MSTTCLHVCVRRRVGVRAELLQACGVTFTYFESLVTHLAIPGMGSHFGCNSDAIDLKNFDLIPLPRPSLLRCSCLLHSRYFRWSHTPLRRCRSKLEGGKFVCAAQLPLREFPACLSRFLYFLLLSKATPHNVQKQVFVVGVTGKKWRRKRNVLSLLTALSCAIVPSSREEQPK